MVKINRIAFSDEQIFTLIELYQENECLWNIKSTDYKNHIKRKTAVSSIAEKMGLTEDLVKKKISSLRATYLMEKKKINDSRKTGASTDELYLPTVPWFEHMHFLNDVIIARNTVSNLDSQTQETENEESEAGNIVEESHPRIDTALNVRVGSKNTPTTQETSNAPFPETPRPLPQTPRAPPVKRRKYSTADTSTNASSIENIDDAIKKLVNMGNQDTFDNFGALIASQLRSIPMEAALQLQMDISQLVNTKLLMIHCNENKTKSLPSSPSRPSTSRSEYSDFTYNYTSEDTRDEPQLVEEFNEPEEDSNIIGETGDILYLYV